MLVISTDRIFFHYFFSSHNWFMVCCDLSIIKIIIFFEDYENDISDIVG